MDRKERMRQRIRQGQGERSPVVQLNRVFRMDLLNAAVTSWFSPVSWVKQKRTNLIDIMPWEVTQKWYAELRQQNGNPVCLVPGDWEYKLEIPIHFRVGPSNAAILCLREAFNKPCCICDEMFELFRTKREEDKKKAKDLQSKWRDFYTVYDYDNDPAGYQGWDFSFHLFEKFLNELTTGDPSAIDFWYPTDGMSVEFKGRDKSFGDREFIETYDIGFKAREPYAEDIVKQIPSWDQFLIIPTPQEVERLYLGMDDNGEGAGDACAAGGGDRTPDRPPTRGRTPEVRGGGETPPSRGRGRGEDEVPAGRSEPARSRGRSQEPPPAADPPPAERGRGRGAPAPAPTPAGDGRCPSGHNFGVDMNQFPDCKTCPDAVFETCADESDKLAEVAKAAPPAAAPESSAPPARRRRG